MFYRQRFDIFESLVRLKAHCLRSVFYGLFGLSSMLVSTLASAEWVQVTGKANVEKGLYDQARSQAYDDALRKASLEFGAQIHSEQEVVNGKLMKDALSVTSTSRIRRAEVQEEFVVDGELFLVMNVELENIQSCPGSSAANYRKAIAVMGFSMQTPKQANYGRLNGVGRGYASALKNALSDHDSLLVMSDSQTSLYGDMIDAPTRYGQEGELTQALDVARDLGAQFIVSGVIRDMSIEDEANYKNSVWQSILRVGKFSNANRRFAVDIFVHDGLSGSIIWNERFVTKGKWEFPATENVGFGSPKFWQAEYGREVKKQINTAAYLVAEQLKCQPFMTRISRIEGRTLHFDSGARTGIRPGDRFSLYRTYSFYDANRMTGIELENVKTALTVAQVHPEFASGTISIEPGRINIQPDDLLIAW